MNPPDVVVLSRFPDIFAGFQESVDRDAAECDKFVVWDVASRGGILPQMVPPWHWIFAIEPFKMSRNANLGLRRANHRHDVLYAGDDTRIIEPDTICRLQELAYSDPDLGILSPRIIGHAQEEQLRPKDSPITYVDFLAFVFVYIKREVLFAIGDLDERFEGYGWDDIDYCYRARMGGFKIGVAKDVAVKHGFGAYTYGSTFIRVTGEEEMGKQNNANRARFAEKWGLIDEPAEIFRAIRDLQETE